MVRLNLIQSLPLIAALLLPATLTAQERVKLTVEQPTGGSVTVSPEPGADGTVSKGSTVTINATPAKGYMLDGIYATVNGPWAYYNECCAPESLLVMRDNMTVGASFRPKKEFADLNITNNVVYARPGKKALRYDVYSPRGARRLPIIIIVHGGGWSSNTEDIMRGMGRTLAQSGRYVVFSIDYRFIGKGDGEDTPVEMYQIIEDVYGAIAHILEHAAQYGGDATRVFITGDSAGGHLSASAINFADRIGDGGFGRQAGVWEFRPTYMPAGKTTAEVRDMICSSLLGAIPTYPVLTAGLLSRWDKSAQENIKAVTPLYYIPDAKVRRVPQLIIRGMQDGLIKDEDMRLYCDSMQAKGQDTKYLQVGGIGHAFFDWRHDPRSQQTFDKYARPQIEIILSFCDNILKERAAEQSKTKSSR